MRNYFGVLNIFLKAILWSYVALFLLGFSLPFYFGAFVAGWWFLIVPALLINGLFVAIATRVGVWGIFRDVFTRRTKLEGRVSRKWIKQTYTQPSSDYPGGTTRDYHIVVEGEEFTVSRRIYSWLSQGHEVVVHHWPHSKTVSRVDKITANRSAQGQS